MTTGEIIKKVRKAKGMTQKQVGDRCGMPDSAIRKYELGSQTPKFETIKRIADALEVPALYLMGYGRDDYSVEDIGYNTRWWRDSKSEDTAYEGLIAILADVYGGVKQKSVEGMMDSYTDLLLGEDDTAFLLSHSEAYELLYSVKEMIKPIVKQIIESRLTDVEAEQELEFLGNLDRFPTFSATEIYKTLDELDRLDNRPIEPSEDAP